MKEKKRLLRYNTVKINKINTLEKYVMDKYIFKQFKKIGISCQLENTKKCGLKFFFRLADPNGVDC